MSSTIEGQVRVGRLNVWFKYPITYEKISDYANEYDSEADIKNVFVSLIQIDGRPYRLNRSYTEISIEQFNDAGKLLAAIPDVFVKHLPDFLQQKIFHDVDEFLQSWSEYHFLYPDLTSYWDMGNDYVQINLGDNVISEFVDREALGRKIATGLMTEDGYFSSIPLDKIY